MSTRWFLVPLAIGFLIATVPSTTPAADTAPWNKEGHLSASFTEVTTSRVEQYEDVTGLSETEESISWQVNVNANFERKYDTFSQEHRINLHYGQIDGVESEDEIDVSNIGRWELVVPAFAYGTARVRSEFDTFAHPTVLSLSTGLGTRVLKTDGYGQFELRTGPRFAREWNPSVDWESLYEFILEYKLNFNETNTFSSQLESYTEFKRPEDYTVRWDNNLVASLNSWLDLRYTFTLYYENTVGEVATKSSSTLNLVYHFYRKAE